MVAPTLAPAGRAHVLAIKPASTRGALVDCRRSISGQLMDETALKPPSVNAQTIEPLRASNNLDASNDDAVFSEDRGA